MQHQCLLGIDLGTGSVKALIVDRADGRALGEASVDYPIDRPEPGTAEQSPEAWWRATVDAVHRALTNSGHPTIEAIGLSGQMHGTVTLDAAHRPNGPAIIWADQRSAREAREIEERLGDELLDISGSRIAPGFQAATLRWLQRHRPECWATTRHILLPKDYLRLRLTGELTTEPSDAAGALLFDIQTRDWSSKLLDAAGVGREQLPPIVPSSASSGRLTRDAAMALGLPPGIPVAGGAADAPAAALGAGMIAPGDLMITLSSGAQVYTPLDAPLVDRLGRLHTLAAPFEPGEGPLWYAMGATLNAGLAYRWLRGLLFDHPDESTFDRMNDLAATASPGANGLLFLPYLAGERTPHLDPDARGAFIGLDARHGRGELVRATLEGVSFALFDAWQVLQETTGANPAVITLAGGGSRSKVWRQILADLFGLPVRTLRGGNQSALGAAMFAAACTGDDVTDLVNRWVRYEAVSPPDSNGHNRYRALFSIFRDACEPHRAIVQALRQWGQAGNPGFPSA